MVANINPLFKKNLATPLELLTLKSYEIIQMEPVLVRIIGRC